MAVRPSVSTKVSIASPRGLGVDLGRRQIRVDESPFGFSSAGSEYRRRQSRMRPSRGPALTSDSPSVWAGTAPGAVTSGMNTSVATITTRGRRPGPVVVPCPATDASERHTRLDASGCTPIRIHRTASTPVCLVRIPFSLRSCVQQTGGSLRRQQLDSRVPSAVKSRRSPRSRQRAARRSTCRRRRQTRTAGRSRWVTRWARAARSSR